MCMAKVRNRRIVTRSRPVRARVRGNRLDLLDPVPLSDGDEVLVTISQAVSAVDMDAMRRAAGAWKGMVDADVLIANIYADRLVATRPVTARLNLIGALPRRY